MSEIAKFLQFVYEYGGWNQSGPYRNGQHFVNANVHYCYWNESPEFVYDKEMWSQSDEY